MTYRVRKENKKKLNDNAENNAVVASAGTNHPSTLILPWVAVEPTYHSTARRKPDALKQLLILT